MARFTSLEQRKIGEIESSLATLVEGKRGLADVMQPMRELLRTDKTTAYGLSPRGDGLVTEFVHGDNFPSDRFRPSFDAWLADKTFGWAGYNPIRSEPHQRNVVLTLREISRWHDPRNVPLFREVFPRWGLDGNDQLRVLICDGPSLLGWVGAFQRPAFVAHQKRLLQRLVPAIGPRLRATLEAALEAMGLAAFVVNSSYAVTEANEAGRLLLAADRTGTLAALRAAIRGQDSAAAFEATAVTAPGTPLQHIVVAARHAPVHVEPRARFAAARWALTTRQSQVLGLVAQGLSNRTIAATLGIAEGTVEVHLTAIFDKVGVRNRSALVSRVLAS